MTEPWDPSVSERDTSELRRRAEGVLDYLKAQGLTRRPFFVEFAGTPKSGKTTCIESVAHFFRRMGYRVLAPTEGASRRTPYYLKEDLTAFNTWSACYALTQILEAQHHADQYHLAILDRGIFDSLVWFQLLTAKEEIEQQDCDAVQRFMTLSKWRDVVDLVVLFRCDPATSLQRENEGKLIDKQGRAMNREFLGDLNNAYEDVAAAYGEQFAAILEIDTNDDGGLRPFDAALAVADAILASLEIEAGSDG